MYSFGVLAAACRRCSWCISAMSDSDAPSFWYAEPQQPRALVPRVDHLALERRGVLRVAEAPPASARGWGGGRVVGPLALDAGDGAHCGEGCGGGGGDAAHTRNFRRAPQFFPATSPGGRGAARARSKNAVHRPKTAGEPTRASPRPPRPPAIRHGPRDGAREGDDGRRPHQPRAVVAVVDKPGIGPAPRRPWRPPSLRRRDERDDGNKRPASARSSRRTPIRTRRRACSLSAAAHRDEPQDLEGQLCARHLTPPQPAAHHSPPTRARPQTRATCSSTRRPRTGASRRRTT